MDTLISAIIKTALFVSITLVILMVYTFVAGTTAKAETVEGTITVTVIGSSSVMLCDQETGECHTPLEWLDLGATDFGTLIYEEDKGDADGN